MAMVRTDLYVFQWQQLELSISRNAEVFGLRTLGRKAFHKQSARLVDDGAGSLFRWRR